MAGAQSRIELIVDAVRALSPLQKVKNQTRRLEDAVKSAKNNVRKFSRELGEAGRNARKADTEFGRFTSTITKAAAAYATFTAAQSAVRTGIARIESERRIQFLAKQYGEVSELSNAAAQAARRFGVSQTEANRALAGVFARLRPVGVSLEDIVSTYNGFNTAARISGATAVEAENAFTQLAQALGSGALRGDEFNSISEQVPGILTAIAKETGVAQGKLRAYAAEGKITADIVIKALKRIETEGADQLAAALNGPAQKIKDFQNATEEVQVALTETVIPELATSFEQLAQLILNLEGPIRFIGKIFSEAFAGINNVIGFFEKGTVGAERMIKAGRLPFENDLGIDGRGQGARTLFEGTGPQGRGLAGLKEQAAELSKLRRQPFGQVYLQLMQDRLATMQGTLKTGAKFEDDTKTKPQQQLTDKERARLAKEAAAAAQRRIDAATRQREIELELERSFQNQLNSMGDANKLLQARLDGNEREVGYQIQVENLVRRFGEEKRQQIELFVDENKQLSAKLELLQKEQEEANRLNKIYQQVGSTISNGVVGMLQAAFDSTKSLADAALNMLQNLANQLLQIAVNSALFGLFPGSSMFAALPRFANGGSISGGQPAIVGEKGPELFMPGRSGSIVPNNALGGATINVSVDASGSRVEGDTTEQRRLGEAIGVAIRQELIKQKRPGGLLA